MMTAAAILQGMRVRLAAPRAWTRGAYARDERGKECSPTHSDARSWCIGGAFLAETKRPSSRAPINGFELCALVAIRRAVDARAGGLNTDIATWQDGRQHAEVLQVLIEAERRL